MKKILFLCVLGIYAPLYCLENAPYVITFFVHVLPKKHKEMTTERWQEMMREPNALEDKIIKKELSSKFLNQGVYASYRGYEAQSDLNGQITFPRETQGARLNLLVLDDMQPIRIVDKVLSDEARTISGFALGEKTTGRLFSYERKRDPRTNVHVWQVKEELLKGGTKISPDTVILFAPPRQIYIQEGLFVTPDSENFIMPPIYVASSFFSGINALRFMKLRHLFGSIRTEKLFGSHAYQTLLGHN